MDTGASSSSNTPLSIRNVTSGFSFYQASSQMLQSYARSFGHIRLLQRVRTRVIDEECWSRFIIPLTFWFFASMTLILGFYGSKNLELGPNSSCILTANSLFASDIRVQDNQEPGPILYGFNTLPELNVKKNWSDYHEVTLQADYHHEWPIWLNIGSFVALNYSIWSTGFFDILVVLLRGSDGLNRWISDPMNPDSVASWHNVHGTGGFTFEAEEGGGYYIAIGNLHHHHVEVHLTIFVHSKLYNTSNAGYQCSLHNKFCGVKLLFSGPKFALLTTPDNGQGKHEVWNIKLSYEPRWVTYVISLGAILSLVLLLVHIVRQEDLNFRGSITPQQSPLLSQKKRTEAGGSYGTVDEDYLKRLYDLQSDTFDANKTGSKNEKIYDSNICAVCYDAQRNSFFDPCGHCVTCFHCGLRIQLGEFLDADEMGPSGACPICRDKIRHVRRIYTA